MAPITPAPPPQVEAPPLPTSAASLEKPGASAASAEEAEEPPAPETTDFGGSAGAAPTSSVHALPEVHAPAPGSGSQHLVQECSQLIRSVNRTQPSMMALAKAVGDQARLVPMAAEVRASARRLQSLRLTDPDLRVFQAQWVMGLQRLAELVPELADTSDPEATGATRGAVDTTGNWMIAVVDALATYCA